MATPGQKAGIMFWAGLLLILAGDGWLIALIASIKSQAESANHVKLFKRIKHFLFVHGTRLLVLNIAQGDLMIFF